MRPEPSVTTQQLVNLQERIVEWLHESGGPLSTKDLLIKHADELSEVGGEELRRAVWSLVDVGKVRFDEDWRLVANSK